MSGLPDLREIQPEMIAPGIRKLKQIESKEIIPLGVYNEMVDRKIEKQSHKRQSDDMLEVLKSTSYKDFSPEQLEYLRLRVLNQAFLKEMMVDARSYVRSQIDNEPERYYGDGDFGKFHQESIGAGSASKFMYFTINPKPEAQNNFADIAKAIEKCTSKVWIKRYMLSYEQRGHVGTPEFGTGLHINLLVEKKDEYVKKKPSECLKEVKNTFKKLCMVQVAGIIVIRYAPEPTNFVNYIRGNKDEDKMALVEADKKWRIMLGIPDVMGNWDD